MGNPSTIWAQLSMPNPPAGSVPFVLTDGVTIGTDVLNFYYNPVDQSLFLNGGFKTNSSYSQWGVVSPVTVNHLMGGATIKAGTNSVVINNSMLQSGAIIIIQRRNTDTTATQLSAVQTSVGVITVTSNANATADVNFQFLAINSIALPT